MGITKNKYKELDSEGHLVTQYAARRKIKELHNAFAHLDGYKRISNHLITLKINNEEKKVGIFRLVPEGNAKEIWRKRVQIQKGDLLEKPDLIICAYINDGLIIYLSTSSIESVTNLPNSVSTLFRINIKELKNNFQKSIHCLKPTTSRGKKTRICFSQNITNLTKKISQILKTNQNSDNDDEKQFIERPEEILDLLDPINAKIIGAIAEELVNRELLNKKGLIFDAINKKMNLRFNTIIWKNEDKESYEPYDFQIDNFFVEVKGSTSQNNFIYSTSENNLRLKNTSNYFLVKLNGIDETNRTFASVKVYNSKEIEKMDFQIKSYWVKEKLNG